MHIGMIGAGMVALAVAREALTKGHQVVLSSRSGPAALACISHSRWRIAGEMARCAVSESRAVVDTKGEYRRAHRACVERVIIFDASARISG